MSWVSLLVTIYSIIRLRSSVNMTDMIKRLLYVEDTYGVDFHREIVSRLVSMRLLPRGNRPEIRRLPARKCNPGLAKKILARILGYHEYRILIVVDKEDNTVREARRLILGHFDRRVRSFLRLVVVDPRHEKWLCIGLSDNIRNCRTRPEHKISLLKGFRYEKIHLSSLANQVDIERLLSNAHDFRDYVEKLRWLMG